MYVYLANTICTVKRKYVTGGAQCAPAGPNRVNWSKIFEARKEGLEEPKRTISKYESETLLLGLQGEKQNLWSAQREGGELCSQRGKAAACAILSLRPAFFSSCLLQP